MLGAFPAVLPPSFTQCRGHSLYECARLACEGSCDLEHDPPLGPQSFDALNVFGVRPRVELALVLDRNLIVNEGEVQARKETTRLVENVTIQLGLWQPGENQGEPGRRFTG